MKIGKMFGRITVALALALIIACSPSSRRNGAAVTLTGCLQPGDSPGTFLLTSTGMPNTAVGTSGASQPSADVKNPTGTPAKSNSSDIGAATTKVYTLIPSGTVDLAKNQGRLVRITGRFDNARPEVGTTGSNRPSQGAGQGQTGDQNQASNNQGSTAPNPATGAGPQSSTVGQPANRQVDTIHVDSVQQLADTCAGKRR